jgi:Spy/CpxP family protein refolding chaperone
MKKRLLVPTLVLGALLTGTLALAGSGGCGSCDKGGNCGSNGQGPGAMNSVQQEGLMDQRLLMMSTVLDLTDTQKAQFEALMTEQRQENQQLREKVHASREALHEMKDADIFNETEFLATAIKQAELKTEMMAEKAKMKQQIYALLTPEQQEKADKLSEIMGHRGKGRHGGF